MNTFDVYRLPPTSDGTFGCMFFEGKPYCLTLEPHEPHQAGSFVYKPYHSPKFDKVVYMTQDIPGHTFEEVHIGNFVQNTDGCLLLGSGLGNLGSQMMIVNSETTFNRFMALNSDQPEITINFHDWKAND